ncbi:VOC family protein [Vibrio sp. RM-69-4]|uniref:VOC family protein n=1 Tax=Vibrio sp. RM-69-4 TaxID=2950157 RepID=UPI00215BC139|nr:VOC family protein [Vibrio sp. RM-69-4]MCR9423158.1 VOC family protein [Vibrio sp. RM-69-4]
MLEPLKNAALHPEQLKQNLDKFMHKIQELTKILHIDLSTNQADHIALRINDRKLASLAHAAWLEEGREISSAQINGRPIIVIEFSVPLSAYGWSIECLELPYPAEGKIYPEQSWEHVEFVVPSEAQTAQAYLQDILSVYPRLKECWTTLDTQGVQVKLSSPKGEGERLHNPTVAFKWQGVCIKLHPHSLKEIVKSEQR